jgi:thiosulfate/3-mercaptopyruvate sulfurtransferase
MTAVSNDDDLRRARLLVGPEALLARLRDPATVVLDAQVDLPAPRFDGDHRVRSGHDGWLAAHIPGSRHADLVDALSAPHPSLTFMRPAPHDFARALAALGVGRGARVVVYDRSDGFWAARLWWMLRWIGVDAAGLDGGWNAWVAAGLPQEHGEAAPVDAAEPLEPDPRDAPWVDRAEIEAALRAANPPQLICALAHAQFSGHAPTRYARRGHIPGSANVPARTLFDATGRYLPAPELRAAFAALDPARPAWLYCGGGISAAVDALALTLIGRDDVRLYDGSLQEWAADAALPLEISA